jgi:Rps23 Pro-64 3,4-dihydroxylase Tpa1-like proline 4-hydroxylase
LIRLFDINPALDRPGLARDFARNSRLQVRDLLTDESARNLHFVLKSQTPWGLAWRAADEGPENIPGPKLAQLSADELRNRQGKLYAALRGREYGFVYTQYPILTGYQEKWDPGGPHDAVMELINDEPFMELIREITGIPQLVKADAQATIYGPGQFLAMHDDSHVAEGWQVAYVFNLCSEDWRPDWGGYLNFYDEEGDIVQGFRPRFNALNLFKVPQRHSVTYVAPFAPVARYAITGWFRDR